MMNAVQPKSPDAVMQALQQHGAAVGGKKMMLWEFRHAKEALRTGVYVTLWNDRRKHECSRLGRLSRCFCNHLYGKHSLVKLKNGRFGKAPCTEEGCKCADYVYMFRRPEEIGQAFLTRRKGFDVTMWRPLCSCKHPHAVHDPVKDRTRCRECNCSKFIGNFCCLGCEGKWDEHEVVYEDRETREELGKAVEDAYFPLADVPDIQKEFLRQVEEQEEKERKKKEEEEKVKKEEEVVDDLGKNLGEVALVQNTGQVATLESRERNTLPARDKPERSVRLMQEQGMLRKY